MSKKQKQKKPNKQTNKKKKKEKTHTKKKEKTHTKQNKTKKKRSDQLILFFFNLCGQTINLFFGLMVMSTQKCLLYAAVLILILLVLFLG